MFRNYFKIAWRNLFRNKIYSLINIAGLALGMTMVLLIAIWINDELSINKSFKNYKSIVRVLVSATQNGQIETDRGVPAPLAAAMQNKMGSDFKAVSRLTYTDHSGYTYGKKKVTRAGNLYVDPSIMRILSLKMIQGGPKALDNVSSIIIDRTLAHDLFGKEDPMNKVVQLENNQSVRITGVYEDIPDPAEFCWIHSFLPWDYQYVDHPEALYPPDNQKDWILYQDRWDIPFTQTIAQLQDHADLEKVSAKIKTLLNGHGRTDHPEVLLHPMSKWHLYDEFKGGKNTGGDIEFVKMFGIIGFFVLLLACINFMNLSTARSERRAREVGIRKSVGSLRVQLIIQFLGESILIAFIAMCLSLVFAYLALPAFNKLAEKEIPFPWTSAPFWIGILLFTGITGLIAGSYPAFYLSSFNAVKVLKGTIKAGRLAVLPRKVLVVLQFSISITLIIGTLVVFQQVRYANNRPIGYDRNGLLTIYRNTPESFRNYDVMRRELMANHTVLDMALSTGPITQNWAKVGGWDWTGNTSHANPIFGWMGLSPSFGKTVRWTFLRGRDFSADRPGDTSSIILSESAVRVMGLKDPLNSIVTSIYGEHKDQQMRVIGIIKDVIQESPLNKNLPMVYSMNLQPKWLNQINIRLNPANSFGHSVEQLQAAYKKYVPDAPLQYAVVSEEFAKNFALEQRIGTLALIFSSFAIFISCLGLFGLASFTAEQRTREIGVRKVLGASLLNLWSLLSKEFLLLVLISSAIALPLAYLFMHNWLQRYDYRTAISIWIFIATMAAALLITLATVSFQSIKASLANPVKSLRSE
jgi:ABC-type antimicrobial peptide transport system permease subunit